ncbi:hypothetical protein AAG906_028237 [Vitis piasezkii]
MQSLMDDFKDALQSYGEDIVVLKKAVLQGSSSGPKAPSKVRVPEPKGFNIAHIPDGEKVSITSMYLTGNAKLWWRTRMEDDAEPKSKGGKKAKVEGKTSKKSGWKKQSKKTVVGGKPLEKTIKFVQQTTRMAGCFICNGPHRARDCPKREKLSALVTVDDKGESDSETPSRVNPLQLLNVIHGETLVQKSLMHIYAVVNGVQVKALVDSGATHNFMATREATRLGLKLEEDTRRIKAVNSKAQKIQGVAKNVPMQIDFLLRAKVTLIPHLGGLVVLGENQPCFVKGLRAKDGRKGQPEMLSAIQLKKGQETYVAALIEIKEG